MYLKIEIASSSRETCMNDTERLQAYDAFAIEVRSELESVTQKMAELKTANKVKTATYRQLFAVRITLKEIEARLHSHGL